MAPTTKSAKSKHEHQIKQKRMNERERQLRAAVKYCVDNGCRGSVAISAGTCPLIKSRLTINKRLDGIIDIGKEKEYCQVLTNDEEELLVRYVKHKNQTLQPPKRRELDQMIIKMLKLRKITNKRMKGGRKYIPLSDSANRALVQGHVGRAFWERFDVKHTDITRRIPSALSLKRVLACTKEMAMAHLDLLAEELVTAGIFMNAVQIELGVWEGDIDTSRIYNHDETPQFVRYGHGGAAPEFVSCEKGEECKQYVNENRVCVTVHPFVSLDGKSVVCHVIFKGETINSNMITDNAVEKNENLFISTTKNGSQNGRTCYEVHKFFNRNVANENKKPLVMLTVGHSSRFNLDLLRFCRDNGLRQFMRPPDSTHVTQLLDQINFALHYAYRSGSENLFSDDEKINRQGFLDGLESVHVGLTGSGCSRRCFTKQKPS